MIKKLSVLALLLSMTFESSAAWKVDFNSPEEPRRWVRVNDSVMGGISQSTIQFSDGIAFFTGHLSLENNGGFASIYRQQDSSVQLSQTAIKIRVKGDGRVYQLRLRTPESYGVSYSASFPTQKDEWLEHTFMPENFNPVFRGRLVLGAPILDFRQVSRLGFLLADKNPGNFTLLVAKVYQ